MADEEEEARPEGGEEEGGAEGEEECEEESDMEGVSGAGKKTQLMKEYMHLISQIEAQNNTVNELKQKICQKSQKQCPTKCEEREIQNLRCCLEKESLKLQCLLQKAMNLQSEDPSEPWGEIPIATSFEEDNMPIGLSYNVMRDVCKKTLSDEDAGERKKKPCQPCPRSEAKDSQSDFEKFLGCLIEQAKREKSKKSQPCPSGGDSGDDKLLKKVICALKNLQGGGGSRPKSKKNYDNICKELSRSYNMQDRLVQDNADLEGDRFKLQEELLSRDKVIECLQQRIQVMQCDLQKLCKEKEKLVREVSQEGGDVNPKTVQRIKKYKECTKALKNNIENMQSSVERMKQEMDGLKRERDTLRSQASDSGPCGKRPTKANEIEQLKANYANLLADYCRKESEMKELQSRVKGFSDSCEKKGNEVDSTEMEMLKEKVNDLREEQEEFKCLIKEQSSQMEDYRNKYLIAQQKVEEQKCLIEKLEMNNKRIEDQINLEIQRIKTKFQDKLKDLAQLPKLLENEQMKLATTCKEKEDLEQKLRLVCKELKALKAQLASQADTPDCASKLRRTEHDLAILRKKYDDLKADKELLCEKLEKTEDDLDSLRTESAKIIARTKERAESQRETLQCRINKLEKELAQCRATASLSISDREEVIKEMKGQLCTLSYSFDSAQKQIKTLKNHISFLSNENCFPIKC